MLFLRQRAPSAAVFDSTNFSFLYTFLPPFTHIPFCFCCFFLTLLLFCFTGGWVTMSNITAVVEPNKRSLVVVCHGLNMQLTENVVSTHTVNILCKLMNVNNKFLINWFGHIASAPTGAFGKQRVRYDKRGIFLVFPQTRVMGAHIPKPALVRRANES